MMNQNPVLFRINNYVKKLFIIITRQYAKVVQNSLLVRHEYHSKITITITVELKEIFNQKTKYPGENISTQPQI